MEIVTLQAPLPDLRRPALVAAFAGWNDAGEAASRAVAVLGEQVEVQPFARIDPEEFVDYQANRPTLRHGDGGERELHWPDSSFSWAVLPEAERDVVLLEGVEPNLRWRQYVAGITELAEQLGVELVVTLGALQVDLPHTRPVPVTGASTASTLGERLRLRPSGYEGPTGITGVLHHASASAGLDAVTLWAGVPHYLAGARYLTGALALAESLGPLLGAELTLDELAAEAAAEQEEIGALVAEDADLVAYVRELEERVDAAEAAADGGSDELPRADVSGDELAAEFERYLRERGPEG